MNILLVEDEPRLSALIARALMNAGHTVVVHHDGKEAFAAAMGGRFELLVLDWNLPGYDGVEVLRRIRKEGLTARVLMLTARSEVSDRVVGLKAGADDYLTKPFAMEELLARVDALGRRPTTNGQADHLTVGDCTLDVRHRTAIRAGVGIPLSPREFEVLMLLMEEPGRAFTRAELSERIWGREYEYDSRTVEILITRLRRKIDDPFPTALLQTVRQVGYTMRAPA